MSVSSSPFRSLSLPSSPVSSFLLFQCSIGVLAVLPFFFPRHSSYPYFRLMNRLIHDQNTLIQASCVLLAVVFVIFAVVVLKFVLKKQRESKTLKYGVIMEAGSVEMRPLEDVDDDDDEDETLFEKKSALDDHRKLLR